MLQEPCDTKGGKREGGEQCGTEQETRRLGEGWGITAGRLCEQSTAGRRCASGNSSCGIGRRSGRGAGTCSIYAGC